MFGRMKSWFGFGADTGPSYLLSDPRVGEIFSYGSRSSTGVSVTQQTAMTYSAWWRAVDLLSSAVAKVPYGVYRNLPDGKGKTVDPSHEWHYPLSRKPGDYWTAFQFRRLLMAWAMTRGNAYAYIDRANVTLQPISPDEMTPVVSGSRVFYHHNNGRFYNSDEILHYKGPGFDGVSGLSVLEHAAESIGLGLGAQRFQGASIKNSARPSVLLKFPRKLDDEKRKRIREDWERMQAGSDNANRTAVIDGEFDVIPFAMNPEQIQLIETKKFTVRDISNFTGVPVHKLGDKDGASYNSLEQETLAWNTDTLEAWYVNIEQEDEDKLLTEQQKRDGSHEIAFDRVKAAFASADLAAKSNYLRVALGGAPYMQISEARRMDNLNHVEGTDEIPQPANMGGHDNQPADKGGPMPGNPSGKMQQAAASALDQGVRRVFKRLGAQAKAAAKRGELAAFVATVAADNLAAVSAELASLETVAGEAHGVDLCGKVAGQILAHFARHINGVESIDALDSFALVFDEKKNLKVEQQREQNGQFGQGDGTGKLSEGTKAALDKVKAEAPAKGDKAVSDLQNSEGFNGPKGPDGTKEISAKLAAAYEKAELTINFHPSVGKLIASDGQIKSAFDEGTDKAKSYMDTRAKQESMLLGLKADTPSADRPKYAAVNFGGAAGGAASDLYGSGVISLNKQTLGGRISLVSGDSFAAKDNQGVGTHSDPQAALARNSAALRAAGYRSDGSHISYGYTEAQVAGRLPLNSKTVKEIRFPASEGNHPGALAMRAFAEKNGIPFRLFDDRSGKPATQPTAPKPAPARGGFFRRLFGGK